MRKRKCTVCKSAVEDELYYQCPCVTTAHKQYFDQMIINIIIRMFVYSKTKWFLSMSKE